MEIIKKVFPNIDLHTFICRIENNELAHSEIEEACLALNSEFLMNGIDEAYEANDYGKEIEAVIDIVNRPRLGLAPRSEKPA